MKKRSINLGYKLLRLGRNIEVVLGAYCLIGMIYWNPHKDFVFIWVHYHPLILASVFVGSIILRTAYTLYQRKNKKGDEPIPIAIIGSNVGTHFAPEALGCLAEMFILIFEGTICAHYILFLLDKFILLKPLFLN